MPIKVKCGCGRTLTVKDEAAGKRLRCPECKSVVEVPMPDLLDYLKATGDPETPPGDDAAVDFSPSSDSTWSANGPSTSVAPPPMPPPTSSPQPSQRPVGASVQPSAVTPASPLPSASSASGEQVFLDEKGVLITDRRVASGGRTYAMAHLTSSWVESQDPDHKLAVTLILVGIVLGLSLWQVIQIYGAMVGLAVFAAGVWVLANTKAPQGARLFFSSGQTLLLEASEPTFARRMVEAVNRALVARG